MPTLTPVTTRFTIRLDLTPVGRFHYRIGPNGYWTYCCYSETILCEWEAWAWTWGQGKGKKGEHGNGKGKEGKGGELMST